MGWLYRGTNAAAWDQYLWKLARGVVRIDQGEWLGLEMRGRGICHLSGLRELPSDGISALWWADLALVDDRQLYNVGYLTQLGDLRLYGQPITDRGLRAIAGLHDLQVLHVDSLDSRLDGSIRRSPNAIGDEGLLYLTTLRHLRHLSLRGCGLTEAGACYLSCLDRVETLDLSESTLADACMPYLSQMKQLTTLFLQTTHISDAAVEYFAELPNLRYLDVTGTRMSSTWYSAFPGVRIFGNERVYR